MPIKISVIQNFKELIICCFQTYNFSSCDIIFVVLYFRGTPLLTYMFYRSVYVLTKTSNKLSIRNHLKPPETIQELSETNQETTDITWNKAENNWYPLKWAISYKFSSRIWNTHSWTFSEQSNLTSNQMDLFKILKRQIIGIINIINVVPMSLLLTLTVISTCSSARSCSTESHALY